jgi:hypothetical protein
MARIYETVKSAPERSEDCIKISPTVDDGLMAVQELERLKLIRNENGWLKPIAS